MSLLPQSALYFVKCQVLRRPTHSFKSYLLITYYVPNTTVGTVFTAVNEANESPRCLRASVFSGQLLF